MREGGSGGGIGLQPSGQHSVVKLDGQVVSDIVIRRNAFVSLTYKSCIRHSIRSIVLDVLY